jgi:hypothetical protein
MGSRAVGSFLGVALALACASEPPPPPQLFTDRPREWLHIRGDDQIWEPYAVESVADHYAEQIVVRRPPNEQELAAGFTADEKPFWDFRVERRLDFGGETVGAAADSLRTGLGDDCAVVHWEKLYETPEDALYEWTHDGCGGSEPEHEIVRFVSGSLGVHRASLRARGRRIPLELRTEWVQILSEARLTGSPSPASRR